MKTDLEYYGDYMLSDCDGHDTNYEYFKTKKACYDRLEEYKKDDWYCDVHVCKFNPKYGYEVIDGYLSEED